MDECEAGKFNPCLIMMINPLGVTVPAGVDEACGGRRVGASGPLHRKAGRGGQRCMVIAGSCRCHSSVLLLLLLLQYSSVVAIFIASVVVVICDVLKTVVTVVV